MEPISKIFAKAIVAFHLTIYKSTGGRLGNKLMGQKVLLLTTTGAKSAKSRTVPLTYFFEDGDIVLTASNAGRPTHPGWYHNLKANPEASIQVGGDKIDVTAQEAGPTDRDALWAKLTRNHHGYATYADKTDRTIPMLRLHLHK